MYLQDIFISYLSLALRNTVEYIRPGGLQYQYIALQREKERKKIYFYKILKFDALFFFFFFLKNFIESVIKFHAYQATRRRDWKEQPQQKELRNN